MSQPIYIKNGRVVDGTGAEPFTASLLIDGDKIAALGASADKAAAVLPDRLEIDAAGLTVMPGLIDAHCHISFDEPLSNDELFFHRRHGLSAIAAAANARKVLRAGVTSMLDADSIFEIGIDLRDAIEGGVVPGPRISTGGYALITSIGGTAGRLFRDEGVTGYAKVVSSKDEIVAEVRRQIKAGVDWIKVHVTGLVPRRPELGEMLAWSADELRLVCDTAHDLGVPVTGHCRNAASISAAVDAGFDLILHGTKMDEKSLDKVIQRRVPICPTFTFQANLIDHGERIGADPALRQIFRDEIEQSAGTLRRAFDAGVPLLCGTESGFSLTPYGEWHYREMEIFVQYLGLTPLQAIRCGTMEGGHALGLHGKIGCLKEGALADVILVDGDPSKDVTVLGEPDAIRHVIAKGAVIAMEPEPKRGRISGWRVNDYGCILTREIALKGAGKAQCGPIEDDL